MTTTQESKNIGQFPISISDLQDRYFDGDNLSEEEKSALSNFNSYRVAYLESATDERDFEKRYFELQIKANLSSYMEFLD
jgi:hypothetical protein